MWYLTTHFFLILLVTSIIEAAKSEAKYTLQDYCPHKLEPFLAVCGSANSLPIMGRGKDESMVLLSNLEVDILFSLKDYCFLPDRHKKAVLFLY